MQYARSELADSHLRQATPRRTLPGAHWLILHPRLRPVAHSIWLACHPPAGIYDYEKDLLLLRVRGVRVKGQWHALWRTPVLAAMTSIAGQWHALIDDTGAVLTPQAGASHTAPSSEGAKKSGGGGVVRLARSSISLSNT